MNYYRYSLIRTIRHFLRSHSSSSTSVQQSNPTNGPQHGIQNGHTKRDLYDWLLLLFEFIAVGTAIYLLIQTEKQLDLASETLKISRLTIKQTNQSLRLNTIALKQQVRSLNEQAMQYQVQYTPYIQMEVIQPDVFSLENSIDYKIESLKSDAVKIISISNTALTATGLYKGFSWEYNPKRKSHNINKYITPEHPIESHMVFPLTQGGIDSLYAGKTKLYLIGNIVYQNVITKKKRALVYGIEMYVDGTYKYYNNIHNESEDIE